MMSDRSLLKKAHLNNPAIIGRVVQYGEDEWVVEEVGIDDLLMHKYGEEITPDNTVVVGYESVILLDTPMPDRKGFRLTRYIQIIVNDDREVYLSDPSVDEDSYDHMDDDYRVGSPKTVTLDLTPEEMKEIAIAYLNQLD